MTAAVDAESPSDRDAAALLAALHDAHCQGLLGALAAADEPLPVGGIVERCDVAESTAYRKLARLRDVGLVEQHERLRSDGRCVTHHALRVDGVSVRFDDGVTTVVLDESGRPR